VRAQKRLALANKWLGEESTTFKKWSTLPLGSPTAGPHIPITGMSIPVICQAVNRQPFFPIFIPYMDTRIPKGQQKQLRTYSDLYPIMQEVLLRQNKMRRSIEYLWVASLNTKNWVTNIELINIGSPNRVATEPPEIFRIPIYKAATSIIMVHNHPSGSLTPSPADKDFTDRMMKVGKLLNITVADHQIITEKSFFSFANAGLMKELAKSGLYEVTHKESEEVKKWREEELAKRTRDDERRQIALRSFEHGLSVEVIVKLTGLRKSSVEKMKRELGAK
jgi:DNA repair protein RadC